MNVSAATIRWRVALTLALWSSASASAVVIVYEGNDFPENLGWLRLGNAQVERSLANGWFIQEFVENGQDYYRLNIGGIEGLVGQFFLEWRAVTDNPEWLIYASQVPTVVVAGGNGGGFYHVVMTESAAVLYRDVSIPWVIVPVSVGDAHTYRIEVHPDEYVWYIDGVIVDSGAPEGPYPDPTARITWGSEVTHDDAPPATTAWDYVRFGRIPDDASGDYDSDGGVGLFDYYFVHDCLTKDGPGIFAGPEQNAGPGCRFTDFDADADADLLDFAEFANQFTGSVP